ncbi:MAG: hypothetical protein K1X83_10095 [Oligoflexia bacterium]|nr:hypothetical protein [Oligoflexia bacterium]
MSKAPPKPPPLEEGLTMAMRAIDNQISRAMQRSPQEQQAHGVLKWEPYAERIELVAAHVLNASANQEVELDSVLVLAQSFVKALMLLAEELGSEGMGKVRRSYCLDAAEKIRSDIDRIATALGANPELM